MGEKVVDIISKLDKSWVVGIIAIILILGLVVGVLMEKIPVDLLKDVILVVMGWFIPNQMVDRNGRL